MPREEQIKQAKEYAEKVLDEQIKVERAIKRIILMHLSDIIDAARAYKGRPELFRFSDNEVINEKVNVAIRSLNEALYQAIEKGSITVKGIAEEREDSEIKNILVINFLARFIAAKTLKQRISLYTGQLKTEIEAFIAAGLAKQLAQSDILKEWEAFRKSPYGSDLIREAIKKGGFAATRIQSRGIHYGKGRYVSSFENLRRLYLTTIQQVYNFSLTQAAKAKGMIGWFTVRGSSYPCPLCESEAFIIHDPKDKFLAYHPFCMCIYIPIYQ